MLLVRMDRTIWEDDGDYKSEFVLSLEDLGRLLPKARYILLVKTDLSTPTIATDWQTALKLLGWT